MVRGAGRGGALSGGNGCYERPSRQNAATSLGRGLTRLVEVALSVYCSFQSCTSKLPRSLRSFGCTPGSQTPPSPPQPAVTPCCRPRLWAVLLAFLFPITAIAL